MPTTYAHWRFGDRCIATLPSKYQELIRRYRNEFNFGVHGPDVLFYYKCIKHNEVNKYGTWMHENISFKETLKMFKNNWKKHDNKPAGLSYMLGFLCHFTLDSYCHGYIDHKAQEIGPSHGKIESQYDRHLLKLDGYNPVLKGVTFSLHPTKSCCHNVAQMYDRFSEEIITKSMHDQVFYLKLLKDRTDIKRNFLSKLMDHYNAPQFKDLMLGKEDDPACADSNMRLDKLFSKAREHYPILAKSYVDYFENDGELDNYFNNHFAPKPDYKSIPLLSLKDEENYVVDFQK